MKVSEIGPKLPVLFWRGAPLVRYAAPSAQRTTGVFDTVPGIVCQTAVRVMEQEPAGQDGEDPRQSLEVQQGVPSEA